MVDQPVELTPADRERLAHHVDAVGPFVAELFDVEERRSRGWTTPDLRDPAGWAAWREGQERVNSEYVAGVDAWLERLDEMSAEQRGSVVVLLLFTVSGHREGALSASGVLDRIPLSQAAVQRADAFLCARVAAAADDPGCVRWAFTTTEHLIRTTAGGTALDPDEAAAVQGLLDSVDNLDFIPRPERTDLRARLHGYLPPTDSGGVDTTAVIACDGWSAIVLPLLTEAPSPELVTPLLRHLRRATTGRPSAAWTATARELTSTGEAARLVRDMVHGLAEAGPAERMIHHIRVSCFAVDEVNEDVVRGCIWAAGLIGADWVVPELVGVATAGGRIDPAGRLTNAAYVGLGLSATPEAIAALQRLLDSTTHNGTRTRITTALARAGQSAGLTPSQLVERAVPTLGLGRYGSADADPADVSARDLRRAVSAERRRIEGLLSADRAWSLDEWATYYLDHPITGRVSRGLLWVFTTPAGAITGRPTDGTTVDTLDGPQAVPAGATVRLWHPATAATAEVSAWRDRLLTDGSVQPFKQAFREIYLLTPAERATSTYSNRFAAHVLRYPQLYALFKARGWVANFLGRHQAGRDGVARHAFPDAGLTVALDHHPIPDAEDAHQVPLCSSDRVWFHRSDDRAKRAVPLDDVPPLVLSEAMRDVDLFVAVTSIALDPTWVDHQDGPHQDYWARAVQAPLSPTAEIRRDVLRRILPGLAVADRVQVGERFVRVQGRLASYQVHLGSAGVLIEPDDRYLCIVPAPGRAKRVHLPFDGDEVLTAIISKILMLAADDRITDPSVLAQLRDRV